MNRHILMAAGMWLAVGSAATAHPHLFIDTGIEVIFDDKSRAVALRITWAYDDLFSLMILEDRSLDPDFDGILTADEMASIQGFDMQWDAGFPGDTYALAGELPVALSRPSDWTTAYADGRLTTTHLRHLDAPLDLSKEPLVVQVYDPSFYTAYTIAFDTALAGGTSCSAEAFEPDRQAADAILQAAIAEQAGSSDVEAEFPAIGAAYAEEVRVTCAAPS
ncbi:MAG: DUF1007 family protein [Paracoccaceae bacterium]